MRYCFRSGRFRPNPRTKHISVPPRHMTKSYIPDFNMISQHYRYKDTTSHTIGIQLPKYITSAEHTCLSTDYNHMPSGCRDPEYAYVIPVTTQSHGEPRAVPTCLSRQGQAQNTLGKHRT